MTKKRKAKAFDVFYNEFKMLEKFTYIRKVMDSCDTAKQLDSAFKWGTKALWSWYGVMKSTCDDRFGVIDGIDIWNYIFKRTSQLSDELVNVKDDRFKRITTVVVD